MDKDLDYLRKAVFSRRPALEKIHNQFGQKSIFEYVNSWQLSNTENETKLTSAIKELTGALYGQEIAVEVESQLTSHPLISTIDHHGILNHPFFINSNLFFSFNDHLKYLVCLSTASVSMNNTSWPGCLVYHDDEGKFCKFSVTSSGNGMRSVFAEPSFTKAQLTFLQDKIGKANLSKKKKDLIYSLVERNFIEEVLGLSNFSAQASILSFKLWQDFFPGAPKVIYLPIEQIVSKILTELLKDPINLFTFLLTQETGWKLMEKYFGGEEGSFINARKGSFLFWGVNSKGRRIHLHRENSELVGDEMVYDLNPESLTEYLKNKEVYPTTLVCFLILLYYHITCIGGFNQTTWLSDIKEKFIQLLNDPMFSDEYNELAKKVATTPTDNFAESPLAFIKTPNGYTKATGIDIFLEGDSSIYEKYRSQAAKITLAESIDAELPEIYPIVFPVTERT